MSIDTIQPAPGIQATLRRQDGGRSGRDAPRDDEAEAGEGAGPERTAREGETAVVNAFGQVTGRTLHVTA